ncbi:MAG: CAP domain-containing protein [Acidimicrobiales bacterium]
MAATAARGVVGAGLVAGALFIASCGSGTTLGAGSGAPDGEAVTEPTAVAGESARAGAGELTPSTVVPSPPTLSDQALAASSTLPPETLPPASETPTTAGGGSDTVVSVTTTTTTAAVAAVAVEQGPSTVASTTAPAPAADPSTAAPAPAVGPSTTVVPATDTGSVTAGPRQLEEGEVASLELVNGRRAELQRAPINRSPQLDIQARRWSRRMAESGEFEHSSSPHAENIAFTSNTDLTAAEAAQVFHALWADSAEHDANMTSESHVVVGIGLYRTDRGWYGTHLYSARP